MTKGGRFVIHLIILLIILFITTSILSLRLVRKSLPKTNGTIKLQGLRSTVKIYRDNYGVPHIFANNEEDLFYTLGFVTAQDRLWQMDISRRIAAGKLSEIYGSKTVETDQLFRTIGLYRTAEQISKQLSSDSQNMLFQYAAGINAYLITNKDNLPLEFTLLNYKPSLWKMEDSIAYQRLMAWGLALGRHYDLIFGALIEKLGQKKVNEIYPEYLTTAPVIIPSSEIKLSELSNRLLNLTQAVANWVPFHPASNCWAISGQKTKTGKPLLANDPHLKLTLPAMLYEVHLVAPFINVYGVIMPGFPAVISGHNSAIAWGSTSMMADDMDFFIEKLDSTQYLFKNQWNELDTTTELIQIKEQQPETLLVRSTQNGPIISDIHPLLKNANQAISMKWTGLEFSDEALASYKLLKAVNWSQFVGAIQHVKVPGQNFVYADTLGNIGYWGAAAIPIRKTGTGEIPYPGWNSIYEWNGYIPFEDLPHLFNPSQQFIVTANNKVSDEPPFISKYWEPPYRAERIIELLSQKNQFTIEDIKQLQLDCYSKHAEFIVPYILQSLAGIQIEDNLQNYFYESLKNWNFTQSAEEVAPSIFNLFFSNFIRNIFEDEMGDTLFNQFIHLPGLAIKATDQLVHQGSSKWFDDLTTPQIEDMNMIILKSIDDAFNYLVQQQGKLIDDWRWGKLHSIFFKHPLSKYKPLNIMFNNGPFPLSGGNCTINMGEYLFTDPFTPIIGPATRQIVDLSDVNNSLSVIAIGQSGQPLDEHYKDQAELWLDGNYHNAIMSAEEIEKSQFNLLVLKPK